MTREEVEAQLEAANNAAHAANNEVQRLKRELAKLPKVRAEEFERLRAAGFEIDGNYAHYGDDFYAEFLDFGMGARWEANATCSACAGEKWSFDIATGRGATATEALDAFRATLTEAHEAISRLIAKFPEVK